MTGSVRRDANEMAIARMFESDPYLVGVQPALDVIPGMTPTTILHAGPPISWERMCGPMTGAVAGALILEGLATSEAEAMSLAASGAISFLPCHSVGAVGPMAGVISASMPVYVVRDEHNARLTFSNLSEGRGKVLRYGGLDDEVISRLRWMAAELGPSLDAALQHSGPFSIRTVLAEALHMGDDCHNRYKAASTLFVSRLSAHISATSDSASASRVLEFASANDYMFLNPGMAAQKAMADSAHGVERSTLVTAMARNGTDFGIRVSGLGDAWFTCAAPLVEGLYFSQFGPADANPDLGDSAIAETTGFGGFAAAASPSVAQFVGGSADDAIARTLEMFEITVAESRSFTIPSLNGRGVPVGIDIAKVIEAGVTPTIHTGVAHRQAGVGQIGAGIVRAPMSCFESAFTAYASEYLNLDLSD